MWRRRRFTHLIMTDQVPQTYLLSKLSFGFLKLRVCVMAKLLSPVEVCGSGNWGRVNLHWAHRLKPTDSVRAFSVCVEVTETFTSFLVALRWK